MKLKFLQSLIISSRDRSQGLVFDYKNSRPRDPYSIPNVRRADVLSRDIFHKFSFAVAKETRGPLLVVSLASETYSGLSIPNVRRVDVVLWGHRNIKSDI